SQLNPTYSASDSGAVTLEATLDGAPFESGASVSAEGAHTLRVKATDDAGNASQQALTFTLDRTPPTLQLTGATEGERRNTPATLSYAASDANLASVSATLDGAAFPSGGAVAREGTHTL